MTSEYLLDAMGLIDDELITEAEEPLRARTPAPALWLRRWGPSLAACLAVAVALGWMFAHVRMGGMGGGSSGASSAGTSLDGGAAASASLDASSDSTAGAPNQAATGGGAESASQAPAGTEAPEEPLEGKGEETSEEAALDSGEFRFGNVFTENGPGRTDIYNLVRYTEELPQGAVRAGKLNEVYPGAPSPSTSVTEYAGRELWLSADGERAYVELPGGGYAEAELVLP